MGRLEGKVAVISGAARGMGATEAKMFAREGAKVVMGDVLDDSGHSVEEEIRRSGGEAVYLHLDVTNEQDWQHAVESAESNFGGLHILVNNAGILRLASIEDTTEDVWDETMAVNVKGVFLGTKYAIPAMRRSGGGSIVNISSTSGLVGIGPPAYVASKGGVRLLTKATAIQYAKDNIRCNSVHPGSIDTDMMRASGTTGMDNVPMDRVGTTEEIAYGVLYLACDESSFVTGSELVIDGGFSAQ